MLVLSRHRDERIVVGPFTTVNPETGKTEEVVVEFVIVDIRGDKVRCGIEAPSDIPVHRREVYEAIRREQTEDQQKKLH